jgi:hypothetical protein
MEYMALSLIKLLLSVTMISDINLIYNYVRTYFLYFYYSSIAEVFFIVLYIIYNGHNFMLQNKFSSNGIF